MANLFNVNDQVVCQKLGGPSGAKPISPPFRGVIIQVLPGGMKYKVDMKAVGVVHVFNTHFRDGVVDEQFIQLV